MIFLRVQVYTSAKYSFFVSKVYVLNWDLFIYFFTPLWRRPYKAKSPHLYPGGCSPHPDHVLGAGGEGGAEQPRHLGQKVHSRVRQLEQGQAVQGGAESEQENFTVSTLVAKCSSISSKFTFICVLFKLGVAENKFKPMGLLSIFFDWLRPWERDFWVKQVGHSLL